MTRIPSLLDIFIFDVPTHQEIKAGLLEQIHATESSRVVGGSDEITNSDWNTPADAYRPYYGTMLDVFSPVASQLSSELSVLSVDIDNYWFQQYYSCGDTHGWHTHAMSMYGMVYYVELPDGAPGTELLVQKSPYMPPVVEGQVLVFPSQLLHRSPRNFGTGRKTIIAANANVNGYRND